MGERPLGTGLTRLEFTGRLYAHYSSFRKARVFCLSLHL